MAATTMAMPSFADYTNGLNGLKAIIKAIMAKVANKHQLSGILAKLVI